MKQAIEPAIWLLAGGILFLSFGYTEMAGSDMWWHIAAGRELFQTGTIWMVDDWSFTAHGADWHNHEWLSDIIYYAWVWAFGVESLAYWKWLVVITTYLLLQYTLYRETGNWTAAFFCAAIAITLGAPFIDVRPHLYTLLNLSLLLYLLLGRRASIGWLLVLFIVWVNMHGGFFFGLMALGILLFPWRELSFDNIRKAVLIGIACLLVTLLNPSGLESLLFPLKYAFDTSSPFRQLGEWLSPFKPGGIVSPTFFYFMWAPLAGVLYLFPAIRRQTGVPWEGLVLTALTLAMSLTSRRFIPIFGISLAVMLAPLVAYALQRVRAEKIGLGLAIAALVVALYRQWPYPVRAAPAFHYLTAEYSYPADIMELVNINDIEGDVFAYYNWGGFLHWRTDGALKVYIDGRADTIYEAEHYNNYVHVLTGQEGWLDILDASGADYFLWPLEAGGGQSKLQTLWNTNQWNFVYRDSTGYLLVRNGVDIPSRLQAPAGPLRLLTQSYESMAQNRLRQANDLANETREHMPWQRSACLIAMTTYGRLNNQAAVEQTAADCYRQFPTPLFDSGR